MPTKKQVINKLYDVPDPELGISLVDLGLIYDATIHKNGTVDILMTLTTMGCPLFGMIESDIVTAVKKLKGVQQVNVDLTFEPAWSPEKMSDAAKIELGFE